MKRKIDVKSRVGIIGASDVGAILGVSPYRTPYDVYKSFKGLPEEEKSPETIERLTMGTELEEFIAKQIIRTEGVKLQKCNYAFYREETPYIICHPDRILVGPDENGKKVGIEIKSSSVYDTAWGEPGTDAVPYGYLCQCLMYIYNGICDTVWLYRFSNNALTKYVIDKTENSERLIKAIVAKLVKFKSDCDNGIEPAAVSMVDVAKKFEIPTEESVEASEEIQTAVKEYKELAIVKKCTEESMEELKVQIADSMGNNSYLIDPASGKPLATFKERTSNRFDSKTFKADNPDMYAKYINTSTSRTLLVK